MIERFILALLLSSTTASWAGELEFMDDYLRCKTTVDDVRRLDCFDTLNPAEHVEKMGPEKPGPEKIATMEEKTLADGSDAFGKLSANKPNFFGWAMPTSDDLGDEPHAEFYLSIKYPLVNGLLESWRTGESSQLDKQEVIRPWIPNRWLFIYNGAYDFNMGGERYKSSPVISRIQNPGTTFEWDHSNQREKFRLGWFHESNGQSLGVEDSEKLFELEEEQVSGGGDKGLDYALARVSRGWDYMQFRYEASLDDSQQGYRYQLEYRYYCNCQALGAQDGREDDIWWDPLDSSRINDFDGLRALAERSYLLAGQDVFTRLELKTGTRDTEALENIGGKLTFGWNIANEKTNIRLTGFYFNGYGKELSTYHLRTEYFGVGLEMR
jgi:hypothetical protein